MFKDVRKFECLMERAMGKGNTIYLLLPMHELGVIDEQKDDSRSEVAKEVIAIARFNTGLEM